ncbi:retropepsin-like domain-containing protein [Paenibacillus thiaminolyticus]|uniref:Retropepsin-like domain-containing protein n=1 Tax=Paenibacillus thiaminolyticus TaxID=49283 RepID=A0AAP9DWG5_PANTH|nr:hypothetical protein [Paenibacillus thiaminolyticus]MCY9538982.1 retropepsin-like domain-containing protein [Paenibacillus thiaminolyticus]MCY9604232.1 retropepsin-like domain-containing protein [Paenibacillus thiaminolyticus]MCY9608093.1 retropepsin-like domain-containing protein [Paenibacillus thiaminolyticus]MCY9612932.1 retropepsin-like domain-containing protein [Paenibacillus thiaminolyticus]MCY9622014.1 retropepsin-like domain-containing protein [Paenibacillus thiaminolyticus]
MSSAPFNADVVREIGMVPEKQDIVDIMGGVGGVEYVYTKYVDAIKIGQVVVNNYKIEIESMDYGMEIHGIIGSDLLKEVGAKIDTKAMKITVG